MAHGVVYFDKSPILDYINEEDENQYEQNRYLSSDDDGQDKFQIIKEAPMVFSEPIKAPVVEETQHINSKSSWQIPQWIRNRIQIALIYVRMDVEQRNQMVKQSELKVFNEQISDEADMIRSTLMFLILISMALIYLDIGSGLIFSFISFTLAKSMHKDLQSILKTQQIIRELQKSIPVLVTLYSKLINLIAELDYFAKNNLTIEQKKILLVKNLYTNLENLLAYMKLKNSSLDIELTDSAPHLKQCFNSYIATLLTFYQTTTEYEEFNNKIQQTLSKLQVLLETNKCYLEIKNTIKITQQQHNDSHLEIRRLADYMLAMSIEILKSQGDSEKFKRIGNDIMSMADMHQKIVQSKTQVRDIDNEMEIIKEINIQKEIEDLQHEMIEEERPVARKTEVFENFQILNNNNNESKRVLWTPIDEDDQLFHPRTNRPSHYFLSELKSALNIRQLNHDDAVYKEFDQATGSFRIISKEERDKKTAELDVKLQEIQEKERNERLEIEMFQRRMRGQTQMKMTDLFSEIRLKATAAGAQAEVFE